MSAFNGLKPLNGMSILNDNWASNYLSNLASQTNLRRGGSNFGFQTTSYAPIRSTLVSKPIEVLPTQITPVSLTIARKVITQVLKSKPTGCDQIFENTEKTIFGGTKCVKASDKEIQSRLDKLKNTLPQKKIA